MKTMIDNLRGRTARALLVPVLLATGMFLGGCESDANAPQESAPTLTEQETVNQAGYVAIAVATIGPEILNFDVPGKDIYQHWFSGAVDGVYGTVSLDFRLGGPSGAPSSWSTADWGRLYTAPDSSLTVPIGTYGGSVILTFDITADIDQGLDSAVLGGGGTFRSGVHQATFTFTNLAVTGSGNYPTGGTMSFTSSGFAMSVAFNGTNLATVTVTDYGTWTLDLETGSLTRPT